MREFDTAFLTFSINNNPEAFADLVRVGKLSTRQVDRWRGQHGKPSADNLILIADACNVSDMNSFFCLVRVGAPGNIPASGDDTATAAASSAD